LIIKRSSLSLALVLVSIRRSFLDSVRSNDCEHDRSFLPRNVCTKSPNDASPNCSSRGSWLLCSCLFHGANIAFYPPDSVKNQDVDGNCQHRCSQLPERRFSCPTDVTIKGIL
jgi:hypothetical protein